MSMANKFRIDMRNAIAKANGHADIVLRKVLYDAATSLVMMSPVGNPSLWKSKPPLGYVGGRFRANWQFATSAMPSGVLSAIDESGSATLAGLRSEIDGAKAGSVHYIVNNLPYAQRLEEGWSRQAPAGMVQVTARTVVFE